VLELGEAFEAGVRREVLEETGVEVKVERLFGVYKNLPRGIVAMVFRCHPRTEAVPCPAPSLTQTKPRLCTKSFLRTVKRR